MSREDTPQTNRAETEPYVAQRTAPPEDAGSQALPVGFRLDEFEILARLGEGGFGIVYRAWDHSLGQPRAIKEYMPSSMAQRDPTGGPGVVARSSRLRETFDKGLQRFIEEAQTLARFDHPALVRVLRRWEANGTAYMAMPLYEGPTLREHLRRLPRAPSEAWLMQLLASLTDALTVVHRNQWLHRDIAPDNILLLEGDRPLLLDFGAARQVIGDVTQELTAILKPGFAPVEQYGEAPGLGQGPWTDVYALAATVHWAVLGRAPAASVSRVLVDGQKPLTETARGAYSERFLAALDKALRVDARQRTQNMAELRADLGLPPSAATLLPRTETWSPTVDAWARTELAASPAVARTIPVAPKAEPAAPSDARTELLPRTLPVNAAPAQAGQVAEEAQEAATVAHTLAQPFPSTTPVGGLAAAAERASPGEPAPRPRKPWPALFAAMVLAAAAAWWLLARPPEGAAPNTPNAPAANTPPSFDLDAQLAALQAAAHPAWQPQVHDAPSSLSIAGQQVLRFAVHSPRDGYLTLLVRGPDGSLTRLLADQAPLRLKAGQTVTLPPADGDQVQTAEPVGREDILVLVSAVPRDYRDLAAGRERSFEALHSSGAAANERLRAWTGPTPLLAGKPGGPCQDTSCTDFGLARFSVNVVP